MSLIQKRSLSDILREKRELLNKTIEDNLLAFQEPILINEKEEEAGKAEFPSLASSTNETFSLSITLNKEQLLAKELAFNGKSFVLTGAAGTGKTTAQREIAASLLLQNKLSTHDFRIQGSNGQRWTGPSVAFVAYTRIASGNLKRAIHKNPELESIFLHNVTTIHNLLEYSPETYWCYEENKEKFRFVPRRNSSNPLDITHLIIEEASMVGLDLWEKLFNALRSDTQIIYLGDINQLQPVFGPSILNYALTQLPVIELTHVYRQAGDSTILTNAHHILNGGKLEEAEDFKIVRGGDTQFSQHKLSLALANTFQKWEELGEYDPEQDIILSPFNVQDLGTGNMNKWISQHLGKKRGAVVHEVIAGIQKLYLAVGDKVFFNKRVGIIKEINKNMEYQGKAPKKASTFLTRFGAYVIDGKEQEEDEGDEFSLAGYEHLDLEKMIEENEKEDLVRQASHHVILSMEDDEEETLAAVGDFLSSTFSLGYCLTIHKAQGCEWRNVYIILHKDHSVMAHRELLYTAVTRASKKVVIIGKDFMIDKAIKTQRIKGNSLKDKIEFFNAKVSLDAAIKTYK
jgi:exodeoxyribonuclease V alpha subunit